MRICAGALAATLVLAMACAAPSGGEPSFRPTSIQPTSIPPTSIPVDTPAMPVDPALADTVELAVADLASRLARDESEIEVVSATQVTWPDGSLGCPQPGMMYTQALVEGSRVILAVDNRARLFAYHAGSDGRPSLCPSAESDGGHEFMPPPGYDT